MNLFGHAQVCVNIHNLDEQKHAQSQAKAQAFLATILQYHEPLSRACLMAGQYQPPQSSETQMCKPGLCQSVLWPCDGSSIGK